MTDYTQSFVADFEAMRDAYKRACKPWIHDDSDDGSDSALVHALARWTINRAQWEYDHIKQQQALEESTKRLIADTDALLDRLTGAQ